MFYEKCIDVLSEMSIRFRGNVYTFSVLCLGV